MKGSPFVFDSYAVLTYLYNQDGANKVADLLMSARKKSSLKLWLNLINLGEVYYIIARNEDFSAADKAIAYIKSWPIRIFNPDEKNTLTAARIKATHPLSYADSFAIATAIEKEAVLITGDPEFKAVEHLLKIGWLP